MISRSIIGIPCREQELVRGGTQLGVLPHYITSILAAGGVPLLVPLIAEEVALREAYENLDGILLTGGEDIDPLLYDEEPHEKLGKIDPRRDFLEGAFVRWAKRDKKPILGICRGMQILNVVLGGSLYQDLAAQCGLEGYSNEVRGGNSGQIMNLTEGRVSKLLGRNQLCINVSHHQAVKEVGSELKVVGRDQNGVIEVVEYKGDWFCIGLQCHPEALWQSDVPEFLELFKELVQESRQFAAIKGAL